MAKTVEEAEKASAMSTERTPLLATVQVGPRPPRYPHNVVRRFCTLALASALLAGLVVFLVTVVWAPRGHLDYDYDNGQWSWPGCKGRRLSYEELKEVLLETPSSSMAEKWSEYYTSGPHLAGQNFSQASWTKDKWEEWGIASEINSYDIYLNRPEDHSLSLLERSKSDASGWKVAFKASLEEDVLKDDPTTSYDNSIPTFHGYSASGNVTAPFVYVNYGTYQDFEDLARANVSVEGKVAIARYGGIFRGLKVKRAQELGAVGVLLYSDPGDDGDVTDENGVEKYPKGPARQPSSVQRGSTEFLSVAPGDPTTPGWPSKPGAPRGPVDGIIPSIPSLPISYADALPLLKALNGRGPKASDLNDFWSDSLGLGYLGVDYNIGPTPDDVVVNLYNKQDYITTPIWNVIGIINGTIPDEVIVVGNHRDAWIVGGAVDPNSGSAVLNEVIRSFGKALDLGWKPLRTVVFASWDGEEYSLLGSTEWVEEYLPWLSRANVAYVNIDTGVSGRSFGAHAAPLLNAAIYEATSQVLSPNQTVPGQTVRDTWDGRIATMGSGSDFTAFQDFAGVPSLDVHFGESSDDAVYHYHSNYDSFYWMSKFGDPGFVYHRTMAQVLGLLVAKLVDEPVVAFRAGDYAAALRTYVDKVRNKFDEGAAAAAGAAARTFGELSGEEKLELRASTRPFSAPFSAASFTSPEARRFRSDLDRLYSAVGAFSYSAAELDKRADELRAAAAEHIPWWRWPARLRLALRVRAVNSAFKQLERNFLYQAGLDGRPWFKHVVFAPGLWTGYAGAVFPGLVESIDTEDWANAAKWVDIIEDCISNAAKSI